MDTKLENKSVYSDEQGFRRTQISKSPAGYSDVLVLGPSSTFGWGVTFEETYSHLIQNSTSFSVFNAGQIGFGIEQGLRLWQQLKKNSNYKYVVIAYGVNDIDRFRFFGANGLSDEDFFKSPTTNQLNAFEKVETSSALWALLGRAYAEMNAIWPCPPFQVPLPRVSPEKWLMKVNQLAESIAETGATPILISSAFHFDEKPHKKYLDMNENLYSKSAEAARIGECSKARHYFQEARQYEIYRVRNDIDSINSKLRALNKKWPVVEIQELLNTKEDFFDPIHPSISGHQKIARALTAVMLK